MDLNLYLFILLFFLPLLTCHNHYMFWCAIYTHK